jgi:hypothetical protein
MVVIGFGWSLDGALDDAFDSTLFIDQQDRFGTYMRPADASTAVYVDDDTGELNVKNGGMGHKMYYSFPR